MNGQANKYGQASVEGSSYKRECPREMFSCSSEATITMGDGLGT